MQHLGALFFLAAMLLVCRNGHAQASPPAWWLTLGGVSVHSKPGYNNTNPALALEARWDAAWSATAGVLRNSQRHTSRFAMAAYTPAQISTPAGPVHLGAMAGVIDGYAYRQGRPFAAGALVAELRMPRVALALIAIPNVGPARSSGVLTLNLKVRLP